MFWPGSKRTSFFYGTVGTKKVCRIGLREDEAESRKALLKGKHSTVDLLVGGLGLDHLLFILKTLFTFFINKLP
jgi:hypothetical protein